MKKISMFIAVMMMALTSAVMVSCGSDDDNSNSSQASTTTDSEEYTVTLGYSIISNKDAAKGADEEVLNNLNDYFKNMIGGNTKIEIGSNYIEFYAENATNYELLTKTIKSVSSDKLDEIVKKTKNIVMVNITYLEYNANSATDLYSLKRTSTPQGTYKATINGKESTFVITSETNEKGKYKATFTYDGTDHEGYVGFEDYYVGQFVSTNEDNKFIVNILFPDYTTDHLTCVILLKSEEISGDYVKQ